MLINNNLSFIRFVRPSIMKCDLNVLQYEQSRHGRNASLVSSASESKGHLDSSINSDPNHLHPGVVSVILKR